MTFPGIAPTLRPFRDRQNRLDCNGYAAEAGRSRTIQIAVRNAPSTDSNEHSRRIGGVVGQRIVADTSWNDGLTRMKRRTRHLAWGATLLWGMSPAVQAQFTTPYPQTGSPPFVLPQATAPQYPSSSAPNNQLAAQPTPGPAYPPPTYSAPAYPAVAYQLPIQAPAGQPAAGGGPVPEGVSPNQFIPSPTAPGQPLGQPLGPSLGQPPAGNLQPYSAVVPGQVQPGMATGTTGGGGYLGNAPGGAAPSWPQIQSLDRMPDGAGNCGPGGCAPGSASADWCQGGVAGPQAMFFQLDMLIWSVSAPDVTTIGDAASEGMVTVGGNTYYRTNSLDTSFISGTWTLGGRAEFGRICDTRGWAASVLYYRHRDQLDANGVWFVPADPDMILAGYQDSNADNIDDDINLNQVHGRSGRDLGTPDAANPGSFIAPFDGTPDQGAATDTGDLVNWLVTFSRLTATNTVQMTGFELSDVYRPNGYGPTTMDWFWGVRYLEFREQFGVTASGGFLDASSWRVNSDNDLIGPQIGARWASNRQWFRFTAEGRFLAALNFQNNSLNGNLASNAMPGGVNAPVALEPLSFNARSTNLEFAPAGEWRLEASYYANDWLAFRLGYTGMVIGGISRASQKVSYTLPNFALSDAGSLETVLVNGLNVGFEINR